MAYQHQANGTADGPDSNQIYQVGRCGHRETELGRVRKAVDFCDQYRIGPGTEINAFYLVHSWDARSILEATLLIVNV